MSLEWASRDVRYYRQKSKPAGGLMPENIVKPGFTRDDLEHASLGRQRRVPQIAINKYHASASFGDQHAHPFPQMRQRHLSLKPVIQPTREDAANSHQASAFAKAFS